MNCALIRTIIILVASIAFIILGQSFSFVGAPPVVTRTDVRDVQAQLLDSNLLVWGLTPKGGISVVLYDPSLKEIHAFKKEYSGFIGGDITLEYCSDSTISIMMIGKDKRQRVHIVLNEDLTQRYNSKPISNPTLPSVSKQQLISKIQDDEMSVVLETELTHPSLGKERRVTMLKKNNRDSTYESWQVLIDSSVIEYGNVLLRRAGKIYVYVNHSIEEGQFIYCFDEKDGKLIYKTLLSVSHNTPLNVGESDWTPSFEKTEACIYSNYYWNEKTNRIMIAGTWFRDSMRSTGMFLMQLDDAGVIRGSIADYPYCMSMEKELVDKQANGEYWRNAYTCLRIMSMGYQEDGTFTVLAEAYAKIITHQKRNIFPLKDEYYHYFSVQNFWYNVNAGSITLRAPDNIIRVIPWTSNHHLEQIAGFIPKLTKMDDELYPADYNRLCDPKQFDGHYVAGFRNQGKRGVKVLTYDSVVVGSRKARAYFSKSVFGIARENCSALLSPDPIKGQDFSKPADYFAANSEWLYRLELRSDGYELSMVPW